MKPRSEIFIVRDDQGPILYAPLNDLIARINEAAVAAISRHVHGVTALPDDAAVINPLRDHGFFESAPVPVTKQVNKPTEVTLFPTDGCNLRCRYCYADAGQKRHMLDPVVGKAAIDRVAENAQALGKSDFLVAFHGNGEPMTAFNLVKELCNYTLERASVLDIEAKFSMATNGVMSDRQLDYLISTFSGVNVSFDGLPEIQDKQRPMADGTGSFKAVNKTLQALDRSGMHYGIRATLTAQSVSQFSQIVSYITAHYPHCSMLNIEPAWECGRCFQTGEKVPDAQDFIKQFISAQNIADAAGLEMAFSSVRTHLVHDAFCGVNNDGFTVTAEGLVTSCFEVATQEDPRASTFIYGQYDPHEKGFVFDEETREALHALSVHNMPYCQNCFCKFHCCGDCPAKVLANDRPQTHKGSDRCQITRALTLDAISRKLNTAKTPDKEVEQTCLKTTA